MGGKKKNNPEQTTHATSYSISVLSHYIIFSYEENYHLQTKPTVMGKAQAPDT